ncbi:MAG: hypothetical protein Q4B84_05455 [Clostridia bacterium]|nr:hypothetical protein [Clostridia bacterium]
MWEKKYRVNSKVNNYSPIIEININFTDTGTGKSEIKRIIFTGDIEKSGLNWFYNDYLKKNTKQEVNLFLISHHGSENGCYINKSKMIYDYFDVKDMFFLSTRKGSYNGIPDYTVLNKLDKSVYSTDKDGLIFYEYDIINNILKEHYLDYK